MLSEEAHMARMGHNLPSVGHLVTYWGEARWLQGLDHAIHCIDEESKNPQHLAGGTQSKSSVLNRIDLRGHMISISLQSNPRAEVKLEFHFWISETLFYLYIYLIWFFPFFFLSRNHLPLWKLPERPALFSKRDVFLTGRPNQVVQSVPYLPCSPNLK